jgi:hypothetical protein
MEKQLSTEQSLDLIARMVAGARQNFNDNGGAMFLIWGYTTIAVTAAVYLSFSLTGNYDVMWLWWAIPAVCGPLTWRHYRKYKKPVTTHIDSAVKYVWIVFSAAVIACMVFGFMPSRIVGVSNFPILFIISLMISTSTAITGLIIKFRPVAIGGFAGIALSFTLLLFAGMMEQFIAFAVLFLLVQVIPGHMLNAYCKREVRRGQDGRAE